jgi:hypothetical protein
MSDSKYGKYVVTELYSKTPEIAKHKECARRVLYLDRNVVEGAFQMSCSWFIAPATQLAESHVHDSDEILGFFGGNPQDPHNLGGEVELWLEDEQFIFTKSTMVFIPKGIKHCPLIIRRVDTPIFHFSTVTEGEYIKKDIP